MSKMVSVLMPVYNCELYVEKAITSILDQTYHNLELIVCDDGSTDDTWNKIKSFTDARIRVFKNFKNQGYLSTYNLLLEQVQGDYFTFQDADDWSDINRIERQLQVFDNVKDIHLCAVNGYFYYTENVKRPCPEFVSNYIFLDEKNFHFMLPSVLCKSEVLNKVSGFHVFFDKTTGGDQYFILDILKNFIGYELNEYLYTARFNPTSNHRTFQTLRKLVAPDVYFFLKRQFVQTGTDWLEERKENLLHDYEKKLIKDKRFMAEKYREYAVYQIDANIFLPGIKLIAKSLSYKPFWFPTYRTIFYALRKMMRGSN